MLELVVRTNWRLLTGAFQLDLDTGELALPHDGVPARTVRELTEELCRGLVYSNVLTVDRCLAEFTAATGGEVGESFERLAL